jgi:hypothetical protein
VVDLNNVLKKEINIQLSKSEAGSETALPFLYLVSNVEVNEDVWRW